MHLVRTSNRLSMAFWAWAVVVAALGTVGLSQLNSLHTITEHNTERLFELQNQVNLIQERQNVVMARLSILELDNREAADEERRQQRQQEYSQRTR